MVAAVSSRAQLPDDGGGGVFSAEEELRSTEGANGGGTLLYSLRPQAIGLATQRSNGGSLSVEAEIVDRSYLGEYWDYQVRPLSGSKPLRVSTPPTTVFEVGSRVWLEIAPSAMVRVE